MSNETLPRKENLLFVVQRQNFKYLLTRKSLSVRVRNEQSRLLLVRFMKGNVPENKDLRNRSTLK